jgi:hypothetical protein
MDFKDGRDCRRFHSSIGTKTAVGIPRRVTICGPRCRAEFKNSEKRDLAS